MWINLSKLDIAYTQQVSNYDMVEDLIKSTGDRSQHIEISKDYPDLRLDSYLMSAFPVASRGIVQRLIRQEEITVNQSATKPNYRLKRGDILEIHWPEPRPAEAQPEDIPLDVVYEDDSILVVNKPVGLVTHPGVGHDTGTLVNAALHHCKGSLSGIGGEARPGIVHRLDKETSGLLVMAKSDEAHVGLANQFAERQVKKIYTAIVCGVLSESEGDIRSAITRHPTHRKRMAVSDSARAKSAHTRYEVLNATDLVSWVGVRLLTGRTHQIRVHFESIGHPLVGDLIYGKTKNQTVESKTSFQAPRQMLHAMRLGLTHPVQGNWMEWTAPLPADFKEALEFFDIPAQ
jgi:23S rRNA pseudouridine1911/1915/1917 synthase